MVRRPAGGLLAVGLLLLLRGGPVGAQDRETPAQRDARLAAEFVAQTRSNMESQTGYHIKGSYRLSTAGGTAKLQNIDFEGVARQDQVTQLVLRAPELDAKEKLPAYKTMAGGLVRVSEKMGWVEFDRLPTGQLTQLVQSPAETFNLIWASAYRVEGSSSTQEINGRPCRHFSLPLSAEAVRGVAARFDPADGALAEDRSSAHAALWVGEDGLVYRLAFQVTMVCMLPPKEGEGEAAEADDPNPGIGGVGTTAGGHSTEAPKPPGLVTRTYDVKMDISDYGKNVDFKIPPEAEKRLR